MALARCSRIQRWISSKYLRPAVAFSVKNLNQKRMMGDKPEGYEYPFLPKEELPEVIAPGTQMTPELRARLAAKYNMRPEDYIPRDDIGYMGDYPKLPYEGVAERDPWYDWDMPELRRNWGEPVPYFIDELDLYSPLDRTPLMHDRFRQWKFWIYLVLGIGILCIPGAYFPYFNPLAPKQYPEFFPRDDRKKFQELLGGPGNERRSVENYSFEE